MNTSQNTKKEKTFKILSLDGGGIRGIISAVILQEIEKQLKVHKMGLHDYFDLVAGTSTGSIIAAGIAVEKTANELIQLYQNRGQEIFPERMRKNRTRLNQTFFPQSSLYPNQSEVNGIARVLKEELGKNTVMSDITKLILFIPAYNTLSRKTTWFASNRKDTIAESYGRRRLLEICVCSASAPTFFSPYPLPFNQTNQEQNQILPYIDGGVSANNPSLSAIAHVLETDNNITLNNISVLSIGTGITTKRFQYQDIGKWGLWKWINNIPPIFLDPGVENSEKICLQILGSVGNQRKNYLRLNFPLNKQLKGRLTNDRLAPILDRPYNEYLMRKYQEKFQELHDADRDSIAELRNGTWLDNEKVWVDKIEGKFRNKLSLEEDIDNPQLCSNLQEATQAYIHYGRIVNGEIRKDENVQDKISQFIRDNQ